MAGLDLGDVLSILSGSERVHPATLSRFTQRFATLQPSASTVMRPSYGLAEATVYVATHAPGQPPDFVHFEPEKLAAGHAKRCAADRYAIGELWHAAVADGADRRSRHQRPRCRRESIGEIWVHGDNVARGYWRRPVETERPSAQRITTPSPGTPEGSWLRTGDLGFVSEGELFIVGRIKDLLIVHGRNHYPDDIEATIQEISGGRVAAISVPVDHTEKLVTIVELKKRGHSDEDAMHNSASSGMMSPRRYPIRTA